MAARKPRTYGVTPPSTAPRALKANTKHIFGVPRPLVIAGGIFTFTVAFYSASLYTSLQASPPTPPPPSSSSSDPTLPQSDKHVQAQAQPTGAPPTKLFNTQTVYNSQAPTFDAQIAWSETLLLLPYYRRRLLSKARGDVLEVSVGTGRNASYYPLSSGAIRSITFVDQSGEMVGVARGKWDAEAVRGRGGEVRKMWGMGRAGGKGMGVEDGAGEVRSLSGRVRWIVGSATDAIPGPVEVVSGEQGGRLERPGEGEGYDTVVETMGLCSTPTPVALLQNLGRAVKPDGRILLLEHGRGYYDWINRILDKSVHKHAEKYGCWYNRDMGELVKESGLEVVSLKRQWFGTQWEMELKRPDKWAGKQSEGIIQRAERTVRAMGEDTSSPDPIQEKRDDPTAEDNSIMRRAARTARAMGADTTSSDPNKATAVDQGKPEDSNSKPTPKSSWWGQ